jgi:hypothetical protein
MGQGRRHAWGETGKDAGEVGKRERKRPLRGPRRRRWYIGVDLREIELGAVD